MRKKELPEWLQMVLIGAAGGLMIGVLIGIGLACLV